MNRRIVDVLAGVVVVSVLAVGSIAAWDAYQRRQEIEGTMGRMGRHAGAAGTDPAWYLLGAILVAAVLATGYVLVVRDRIGSSEDDGEGDGRVAAASEAAGEASPSVAAVEGGGSQPDGGSQPTPRTEDGGSQPDTAVEEPTAADESSTVRPRVLDVLPEDERRIVAPLLESPGMTQVELRDHSAFSKSKVSETVTDLEERGLLDREPHGQTYRIYPTEDLRQWDGGGERPQSVDDG